MKRLNWAKTLFNLFFIQLLLYVDACAMSKTEKFLEIIASSEKASYYISFNDVDIFTEANGAPNRQTLPINHWAKNGDNTLLVSVNFDGYEPVEFSNKAKLNVALYLRVKDQGNEKSFLISEFNLSPSESTPDSIASSSLENIRISSSTYNKSEDGDIHIGKWKITPKSDWYRFEQNIKIDIGLPKWSYLSADFLGNEEEMSDDKFYGLSDELYLEYKKIWELMKDKKTDEILTLTNLRSDEMNKAFNLETGSKQQDMKKSLKSALDNDDLSLFELIDNERAQLTINAYGKIAIIKVADTDVSPILFTHIRDSFTRSYDFYFMKKDGKWIIIR